jgi:hypothetical protein
VVSANLCRRHMSDGQRAMVAARLKDRGFTSANLRSEKKSEQAAAALNVKPRTVESAVNIIKSGIPRLVQAVLNGEISVSAGEIVAKKSAEEQANIVENGKDAIVEAASRARKAKKSAAGKLCASMETSRAEEQQSALKKDESVGHCDGSDVENSGSIAEPSCSEPIELTSAEAQLVIFFRQGLEKGTTWVIAGTGKVPELQTGWLIHMVYAEDPSHVSPEKHDPDQEVSVDDVQNPAELSGAGEPKLDADSEPAVLPTPKKGSEIDPVVKEALRAAAKEYFRRKKQFHGDIREAEKLAKDEACRHFIHGKGLDWTIKDSVIIGKLRKMGWWPQTRVHEKEVDSFFRTIEERLETGDKLKYDRSKNIQRRSGPKDHRNI